MRYHVKSWFLSLITDSVCLILSATEKHAEPSKRVRLIAVTNFAGLQELFLQLQERNAGELILLKFMCPMCP